MQEDVCKRSNEVRKARPPALHWPRSWRGERCCGRAGANAVSADAPQQLPATAQRRGRLPPRTKSRESVRGPPAPDWFRGWMPGSVHGNAVKRERSPCSGLVPGLHAGECSRAFQIPCCSGTALAAIMMAFLPHLRWQQLVMAFLPHLRPGSNLMAFLPHLRPGSNGRSISATLHPPARSFRPAGCAAETAQPKEIIDRALSSPLAQALANILLHLLSVRSAGAELICGGASRLNFTGREGFQASNVCDPSSRALARRAICSGPFCQTLLCAAKRSNGKSSDSDTILQICRIARTRTHAPQHILAAISVDWKPYTPVRSVWSVQLCSYAFVTFI